MTIRGAEYAVARVIAVLQANLPAELDLLDTPGGGLPAMSPRLENVDNARYYDWHADAGYIENYPAIVVTAEGTEPFEITTTTNTPGIYNCIHRVTVAVIHKNAGNEAPGNLCRRNKRTALGVERVIAIKNPTCGDDAIFAERDGEVTYVESGQTPEAYVVTSRIPFLVRLYENL